MQKIFQLNDVKLTKMFGLEFSVDSVRDWRGENTTIEEFSPGYVDPEALWSGRIDSKERILEIIKYHPESVTLSLDDEGNTILHLCVKVICDI